MCRSLLRAHVVECTHAAILVELHALDLVRVRDRVRDSILAAPVSPAWGCSMGL